MTLESAHNTEKHLGAQQHDPRAEGARGAYLPLSAKALKAVSCRRPNGQLNGNVEAKSC